MREQVEEAGGWHAVAQVACVAYVAHAVAYAEQALLHEPESSGENKRVRVHLQETLSYFICGDFFSDSFFPSY